MARAVAGGVDVVVTRRVTVGPYFGLLMSNTDESGTKNAVHGGVRVGFGRRLRVVGSCRGERTMVDLIVTYRGVVYPSQCDHMGHMNVASYVAKFDEASWQLFLALGITPSRIRNTNRGMAGVEQHIEYKHELRPGDVVTVRSGVLEVREKSIRFGHRMDNDETGDVVATTILTAVHLDLVARRACVLPEDVRERARQLIVPML